MKINKKFTFLFLIFFLISFAGIPSILADSNLNEDIETTIHFFQMRGCPDCTRQKEFLQGEIIKEYPDIEIIEYSITDSKNQNRFHELMEERDVEDYQIIVPTLFIGNNVFQMFYEEDKELIKRAIQGEDVQNEIYKARGKFIIEVPLIGKIDFGSWSLPLVAFVIGLIDGLNVCSIGALILILMIVLTFQSRKKIIFYGGLFILTVVTVYGLLVFVWTALFHTLASYIGSINKVIGIAALGGGIFFLNQFINFCRYGPACEYSGNKFIVNSTNKVKEAFKNEKSQTIALAISVIFFAAIVTLVELPCSFGLPMVYGAILVGAGLSWASYVFYILLYLFFYMLIQLVIFAGAVITKEVWFSESKMITWIYGAGTIVLFFLAYYYLVGF